MAEHPVITYHEGFTGRARIDETFAKAGLTPDIVMSALDADVIKAYVELGLGVGIVASMAYDPNRDQGLRMLASSHLFEENVTRIAVRKGISCAVLPIASSNCARLSSLKPSSGRPCARMPRVIHPIERGRNLLSSRDALTAAGKTVGATSVAHPRVDHRHAVDRSPRATEEGVVNLFSPPHFTPNRAVPGSIGR
jgi:hypothetical protein